MLIFSTTSVHHALARAEIVQLPKVNDPADNYVQCCIFTLPPGRGGGVSVSVCLWAYIWNYTSDLHQFFVPATYVCGSVLLWRHSGTLCTSSFINDVTFAHKQGF